MCEKQMLLTVTTPSLTMDFLDLIMMPATLFEGFAFILSHTPHTIIIIIIFYNRNIVEGDRRDYTPRWVVFPRYFTGGNIAF